MRRIFPALLLPLVLVACGSREVVLPPVPVSDPASGGAASAPIAGAPRSERMRDDEPLRTAGERGHERRSKQRKGDEGLPGDYFGPAKFNTMRLDVTLSATCATPGQMMSATADTVPGSKLAFAASYSDNDFVPNFTYVPGEGNPTGTFTWSWEIMPTTPRGEAMVTVVAAKGNKGASFRAAFRVADAC